MYYTLAKEEPGHASPMRIYLRSDWEGADPPSILPEHTTSPAPWWGRQGSGGQQDGQGVGGQPCPAEGQTGSKGGSGQRSQPPAKD